MNYNTIFSKFPILDGINIRLRKVVIEDIPILFNLLGDPDIITEYSPIGRYQNLQQVADNYLFGPEISFTNKTAVVWAIEDKKNSQIIGIRELYIDNPIKPVTVQGFIAKAYRNKGFSKEAYNLIINFARRFGATGILANASIENYPAIALMYSVGFEQKHVIKISNFNMRAVFYHNLSDFQPISFQNEDFKRIYIFCKMYLKGKEIEIEDQFLAYFVKLVGTNTESNSIYGVYSKQISFFSDSRYIWNDKYTNLASTIEGTTRYVNAWAYIWEFCVDGIE